MEDWLKGRRWKVCYRDGRLKDRRRLAAEMENWEGLKKACCRDGKPAEGQKKGFRQVLKTG